MNGRKIALIMILLITSTPVLAYDLNLPCRKNTPNKPQKLCSAIPVDNEFLNWKDLKRGQKGFGLTVFEGVTPERFFVTFNGTRNHPIFPKKRAILVRMGEPLIGSGVLAGMSGSPVYFQDPKDRRWKLVGAIAFGFGDGIISNDESVGGVTPIQDMLNPENSIGLKSLSPEIREKLRLRMMNFQKNGFSTQEMLDQLSQPMEVGSPQNQPLRMLLPRFTVIHQTSQGTERAGANNLVKPKPGEAVAMALVEGDYQITATCTITHVTEDEFWACGHPIFGEGKILLPAYKGIIATSIKSSIYAFKEVEGYQEPYGYIDADYTFAVRGKNKPLPPQALLRTNLTVTIGGSREAGLALNILRHNLYSQVFLDWLREDFLNILWPGENDKATAQAKTTIAFLDREPLVFYESSFVNKTYTSWFSGYTFSYKEWPKEKEINRLGNLLSSRWKFLIESINTTLHIEPGERVLAIDSLALLDRKGKPTDEAWQGEELKLVLVLRERDTNRKFITGFPIKIPKKLDLQRTADSLKYVMAAIYIESGNHYRERDPNKRLNHEPDSPEEFLKELSVNERDHRKLFVHLVMPPANVKSKPNGEWPKLEEQRWLPVENVSFLRETKSAEIWVATQERDSPETRYLLDTQRSITIKIKF